ncbi:membrane protein [Streptomyces olivaceus]|nr:membrane protein [Streptomyces olivaceus]
METPPGSHHDGPYQDDPRYDDPWYDALASGWGESAGAGALEEVQPPRQRQPVGEEPPRAAADVYLEVQRSEAFQEVRSRYRRFVVPAGAAFFVWYIAYVVTATTAPALMARPVAGAVNVGMLAGIGQFLTTFLLTWAYARHARLRRDRAALELRWDTQELTRGARGGAS